MLATSFTVQKEGAVSFLAAMQGMPKKSIATQCRIESLIIQGCACGTGMILLLCHMWLRLRLHSRQKAQALKVYELVNSRVCRWMLTGT